MAVPRLARDVDDRQHDRHHHRRGGGVRHPHADEGGRAHRAGNDRLRPRADQPQREEGDAPVEAVRGIDLDVHRLPNVIVLPAYPVLGLARARFSQDAIGEFRVIANRFDTEIGGSAPPASAPAHGTRRRASAGVRRTRCASAAGAVSRQTSIGCEHRGGISGTLFSLPLPIEYGEIARAKDEKGLSFVERYVARVRVIPLRRGRGASRCATGSGARRR